MRLVHYLLVAFLVLASLAPVAVAQMRPADSSAIHQVTVRLTLPSDRARAGRPPYYLAAEHNAWRLADSAYRFRVVDGRYQLTFPFNARYFLQYRITRGSEATSESDRDGYRRGARLAQINRDTLLDVTVAGFSDLIVKASTAPAGRVVLIDSGVFFPTLGRRHTVRVLLPKSYRHTSRRYPLLLLMDGEAVFDRATTDDGEEWRVDESLDSLVRARGPERIVVAIDAGAHRGNEYLPYATPDGRPAAQGDAFLKDVVETLLPVIRSRFRTLAGREHTAIGGSSMGAAISLHALTEYPAQFGAGAIFSLPRWSGFPMAQLLGAANRVGRELPTRVYLYVGGREGSDQSIASMQALHARIAKNPRADVVFEYNAAGEHRAAHWRAPFARFASWLGGERPSQPGSLAVDLVGPFRAELLRLGTEDQAVRDTIVDAMQRGTSLDTALVGRQARGDVQRATWLGAQLQIFGWPTKAMVGDSAAEAAFLIAQHATHDTAFLARVQPLLTQAAETGDASSENAALFTDRLAIRRGQPQVYGTQATMRDGRLVVSPIADSANVDARRARIGLSPLALYVKKLEAMYLKR